VLESFVPLSEEAMIELPLIFHSQVADGLNSHLKPTVDFVAKFIKRMATYI
jgi:hypothetical protein